MKKDEILPISNKKYKDAEFVILGVEDDSGSTYRKGSRYAPKLLRKFIEENKVDFTEKNKKSFFGLENKPFKANICDIGNVTVKEIGKISEKIYSNRKKRVMIGGDHSITYKSLKNINFKSKWGIIYFDAHPDIISSRGVYFGSVINDISKLKNFDPKASFIIGMRTPEDEELKNIKKLGINIITPLDLEEKGVVQISKKILSSLEKNTYLSIDMDVLDPAFAPGVTEPEPAGLTPVQLVYLCKEISKKGLFGFDIMELCPKYDINNRTLHLAYRIILEIISSSK